MVIKKAPLTDRQKGTLRVPQHFKDIMHGEKCQRENGAKSGILRFTHKFCGEFMEYPVLQKTKTDAIIQVQRGDTNVQVNQRLPR